MNLIAKAIVCIGAVASVVVSSPLNVGKCLAQPSPEPDTIIGGYNASIKDFPYQVSMFVKTLKHGVHFQCGGFIISEYYILSAAHCLNQQSDLSAVFLYAGSIYRGNGTFIPVANFSVHPGYHRLDKDVAVLKTAHPIQFTDVIQPIKLPTKNQPLIDGSLVTVSGWGLTKSEDPMNLKAVKIPVVNFNKCHKIFDPANGYPEVTRNMWCAGGLDGGGKGACHGDSGGPAVQDGTVVGIVSWGQPCAVPHYPDVYTYIAAPDIRDFITKHTGM